MAFEILEEVVPELVGRPPEEVGKIWREWMNAPEQDDIMPWLQRPLSDQERRTIQTRFARHWYTPQDRIVYVPNTGVPQAGEPSGT
jgi:hypothetical protein